MDRISRVARGRLLEVIVRRPVLRSYKGDQEIIRVIWPGDSIDIAVDGKLPEIGQVFERLKNRTVYVIREINDADMQCRSLFSFYFNQREQPIPLAALLQESPGRR